MLNRNQMIIAGVALVLAAGVVGFLFGRATVVPKGSENLGPSTPPSANVAGLTLAGENAIAANDQPPGSVAAVAMVTLAKDGWVVIHDDENGKPSRIPGATRLNAGTHRDVTVELLRPMEEGRVYYAMLHSDDGDRKFDRTKDLPLADPQGNTIMMRFVATTKLAP